MNYFWAFCVGGGICVVGQLLIDLTGLTPARILTGYVVAGVLTVIRSMICNTIKINIIRSWLITCR